MTAPMVDATGAAFDFNQTARSSPSRGFIGHESHQKHPDDVCQERPVVLDGDRRRVVLNDNDDKLRPQQLLKA
jgi:hypothetical protein